MHIIERLIITVRHNATAKILRNSIFNKLRVRLNVWGRLWEAFETVYSSQMWMSQWMSFPDTPNSGLLLVTVPREVGLPLQQLGLQGRGLRSVERNASKSSALMKLYFSVKGDF